MVLLCILPLHRTQSLFVLHCVHVDIVEQVLDASLLWSDECRALSALVSCVSVCVLHLHVCLASLSCICVCVLHLDVHVCLASLSWCVFNGCLGIIFADMYLYILYTFLQLVC